MSHASSRIVRALVDLSGLPMTEDEVSTLEASYETHREALSHLRSIEDQEYPVSMAPSSAGLLADDRSWVEGSHSWHTTARRSQQGPSHDPVI